MPSPIEPLSRTGEYYAKAWRRFVLSSGHADIPRVRPTVSLAGHALVDEVVLAGFKMLQRDEGLLPRIELEIEAAATLYGEAGWIDAPERFHGSPPPATEVTTRAQRGMRYPYQRLSFESGYEPHPGEPGRERWLGYLANRRVRGWLLRHDEPRPWLVCIHGARMGRPNIDLTLFRARWLHEELGLNVVFPVQPLHGPRGRGLPKGTAYPGGDLVDNIHGAAQAVWDVRRVLGWIRAEDPGSPIGISGVSLGGYVGSVVASLDGDLACAVLGVPAVDLVDLIGQNVPASRAHEWDRLVEPARRAGWCVSPLAMSAAIPRDRRFMYAGLADRIVHPHHQVLRLWEHWERPEIHWFAGGHALFFRSNSSADFLRNALVRSGLVTG